MRSIALRAALAAAVAGPAVALAPQAAIGAAGTEPVVDVSATQAAPSCTPVPSAADEAALLAATNATRAANGIARMRRDDHIGDAARAWSVRMARTGAFVHSSLSWARGRAAGENIAQAGSAAAAYRALLDSPAHRRNILSRSWRFVGLGAARCDGSVYVTQTFIAGPAIRA